jgi:hypothetical protein
MMGCGGAEGGGLPLGRVFVAILDVYFFPNEMLIPCTPRGFRYMWFYIALRSRCIRVCMVYDQTIAIVDTEKPKMNYLHGQKA